MAMVWCVHHSHWCAVVCATAKCVLSQMCAVVCGVKSIPIVILHRVCVVCYIYIYFLCQHI